jgi:acyl carrier protein
MADKEEVKKHIALILKQPNHKLEDDVLLTNLVTDSFVLVDMVIELQEEFGITLVQEDLKNVRTVGDLVDLFIQRTAKK